MFVRSEMSGTFLFSFSLLQIFTLNKTVCTWRERLRRRDSSSEIQDRKMQDVLESRFCPYGSRCMFIHDESTDEIETFKTRNLTRTTSRDLTPDLTVESESHAGLFNNPMCPPAPVPTQSRMTSAMFFQQQQPQVLLNPRILKCYIQTTGCQDSERVVTSKRIDGLKCSLGSSPTEPQKHLSVENGDSMASSSLVRVLPDSKEMKTDWRPDKSRRSPRLELHRLKEKSTTVALFK